MKKVVAFLGLVLTGVALGETYTLSAPGNGKDSVPSFDSANGWSPAATSAPCEGNDYVVLGTSESALSTIRMQESK